MRISASGIPEFEFNRALAVDVKAELEKRELKVRLIGERGDYAVLHHRTRDARGAELFVSIHHDSVQERWLPQADRFAGFTPSRYHADAVLGEARPFADEANGVHYFDKLAVAAGVRECLSKEP